jgi:hypothetical protein
MRRAVPSNSKAEYAAARKRYAATRPAGDGSDRRGRKSKRGRKTVMRPHSYVSARSRRRPLRGNWKQRDAQAEERMHTHPRTRTHTKTHTESCTHKHTHTHTQTHTHRVPSAQLTWAPDAVALRARREVMPPGLHHSERHHQQRIHRRQVRCHRQQRRRRVRIAYPLHAPGGPACACQRKKSVLPGWGGEYGGAGSASVTVITPTCTKCPRGD